MAPARLRGALVQGQGKPLMLGVVHTLDQPLHVCMCRPSFSLRSLSMILLLSSRQHTNAIHASERGAAQITCMLKAGLVA